MSMKQGLTVFLKVIIILLAIGVFAGMIRFPQIEGRAVNLDLVSIYADPFIIYLSIASIPFFIALYQAYKLVGSLGNKKVFSQIAVKSVRNIKFCALAIVAFIVAAEVYLFVVERSTSDDSAGGVMMGLFVIFVALIIASVMAIFQRRLQNAVDRIH